MKIKVKHIVISIATILFTLFHLYFYSEIFVNNNTFNNFMNHNISLGILFLFIDIGGILVIITASIIFIQKNWDRKVITLNKTNKYEN